MQAYTNSTTRCVWIWSISETLCLYNKWHKARPMRFVWTFIQLAWCQCVLFCTLKKGNIYCTIILFDVRFTVRLHCLTFYCVCCFLQSDVATICAFFYDRFLAGCLRAVQHYKMLPYLLYIFANQTWRLQQGLTCNKYVDMERTREVYD